jgi:hypothetical protein
MPLDAQSSIITSLFFGGMVLRWQGPVAVTARFSFLKALQSWLQRRCQTFKLGLQMVVSKHLLALGEESSK